MVSRSDKGNETGLQYMLMQYESETLQHDRFLDAKYPTFKQEPFA